MEEQAEDEEDPNLLLEKTDEYDLVDLDARLMLEIVRGIGMDSFEGVCSCGFVFWLVWWDWLEEEEVRAGPSGGSIVELFPF